MKSRLAGIAVVGMLLSPTILAAATVTLTLESPVAGQTIAPGAPVAWSIRVTVSSGDNEGLALLVCDLVQDAKNAALFDIPQADPKSIPAELAGFDRPRGITNPAENGAPTGFVGVQRGAAGQKNLVQVGGAQNTFGQKGSLFGTDIDIEGGIGQSGPQLVVSGSFPAPATVGAYTFRLANGVANVLVDIRTPPLYSEVASATVSIDNAAFSFTVGGETVCAADSNCDGSVDFNDIDYFVAALVGEDNWLALFGGTPSCGYVNNDCNFDGDVNFNDIDPFVAALVDGNCIKKP